MKLIYFWKPLLWLAIICYLLFIPADELPTEIFFKIPHIDKIVHFALFFVFCLLMLRPLKKLQLKFYLLAPLISILLSALLEFIQHLLSSTRNSDLYDFMANATGVAVATLFYRFFVANRKWELLF